MSFANIIRDTFRVMRGYSQYRKTKRTPEFAYYSMRRLFTGTNGRFNNVAAKLETVFLSPYNFGNEVNGILGKLSRAEVKQVSRAVQRDGFYIFPQPLPPEKVTELVKFSRSTPAIPRMMDDKTPLVYDSAAPQSPIYDFPAQSLFESPLIQSLLTDESVLAVAQEYVGPRPVLDLVTMWWSTAVCGKVDLSQAAQLYHFDMDRIKFLKFFIYLTDVDSQNGPHCYVRQSQRIKPKPVRKDGRIKDEELMANYPKEDFVEITGKAGTILAVDTSGFHKGKPLEQGERLLFQMEFASSMFGQYYPPVKSNEEIEASFGEMAKKYDRTYKEILQ
ncbi:phytanoyl-CoA dioxygenase family protein [Chitinophaga sp. GCM10012297]|uniref:Phytanoyl-CoA dioxygenase family protein n=1 Tax=Chitinophaga chungangae TaxID=2821488 RepID=A0ABS3YG18_9BACT|nr:phytanoyl-CoA dioxygenase family protein [Chitinophaga chungangae]MBO9153622.1 phytanoyl-CoA dioxygenase family protein [Chitinophaga chungangae]